MKLTDDECQEIGRLAADLARRFGWDGADQSVTFGADRRTADGQVVRISVHALPLENVPNPRKVLPLI